MILNDGQRWSMMVNDGQGGSRMVKDCPGWSRMFRNTPCKDANQYSRMFIDGTVRVKGQVQRWS